MNISAKNARLAIATENDTRWALIDRWGVERKRTLLERDGRA